MNTKETAKRWSCNRDWVGKQCREGMIPLAEKKKLGWDIPEEAEMPPCTRRYAVSLLQQIEELQNGISVSVFREKEYEKQINTYRYLSDWGFISEVSEADFSNRKQVEEKIRRSRITERGRNLIEVDKPKEQKISRKESRKNAAINLGICSCSYSSEIYEEFE